MLLFNNQRILHGRTEFKTDHLANMKDGMDENEKMADEIDRHLQGCYFDWDQIYWRIRPIKKRVEANTTNQEIL